MELKLTHHTTQSRQKFNAKSQMHKEMNGMNIKLAGKMNGLNIIIHGIYSGINHLTLKSNIYQKLKVI